MQELISVEEIFSIRNIVIYLLIINVIGILIMWIDKRRAKWGKWRIPEKTLFLVAGLGGSIGTIIGMHLFRHKTQKLAFIIGFPGILILQIVIICMIVFKI